MTKANSSEIVIVLDRSGSMSTIAADMCGGFDSFVKEQMKVPGECKVTLIQFDAKSKKESHFFEVLKKKDSSFKEKEDWYEVVYEAMPLNKVPPLELIPRGMTALLDALGLAIENTGKRLSLMKEEDRPSQVLIVIITDGEENASTKYTRDQIFEMISHQKDKYNWEFIFLGANQDAIGVAADLGIVNNAVTYNADAAGTHHMMEGLSRGVERYRTIGNSRLENIVSQQDYNNSLKK